MPKLTKRYVEKIEPDSHADYVAWDDELRGFGVRIWPSGKRSYVLKYRTRLGRQRKITIGPHGPLTAEKARTRALNWLSEVKLGGDPAQDMAEDRKVGTVTSTSRGSASAYRTARPAPRSSISHPLPSRVWPAWSDTRTIHTSSWALNPERTW